MVIPSRNSHFLMACSIESHNLRVYLDSSFKYGVVALASINGVIFLRSGCCFNKSSIFWFIEVVIFQSYQISLRTPEYFASSMIF